MVSRRLGIIVGFLERNFWSVVGNEKTKDLATQANVVQTLWALDPQEVVGTFQEVGGAIVGSIRVVEGLGAEQAPTQIHPLEGGRSLTQTSKNQATVG